MIPAGGPEGSRFVEKGVWEINVKLLLALVA